MKNEITVSELIYKVLDKNGFRVAKPDLFFDNRNTPYKVAFLILSAAELKSRRQFCDRAGKLVTEEKASEVNKILAQLDEIRVKVEAEGVESFSGFLLLVTQALDAVGDDCRTIGEIMLSWSKAEEEWAVKNK